METGGAEHAAPVVFCFFYGGGGRNVKGVVDCDFTFLTLVSV